MISPTCVLTARHCINPAGETDVTHLWYLPAGLRALGLGRHRTTRGAWMGGTWDVGIILLDRAVNLARYPTIVKGTTTTVRNVSIFGLKDDGVYHPGRLYRRDGLVAKHWNRGFWNVHYGWYTSMVTERGDSGGPWMMGTIIGVHQGINRG